MTFIAASKRKVPQPVRTAVIMSLAAAALAGCAAIPNSYSYTPPGKLDPLGDHRTIDASYDKTWTGLIDYVSSTFFSIDNFEKASGLLTLSFGDADVARFVDCGQWTENGKTFPYAARTDQGLKLNGRMNLRVRKISADKTEVRVSTLYVLRNDSRDVWDFTSNTSATVDLNGSEAAGTPPLRTCQSSHEAERQILTGIAAIASS